MVCKTDHILLPTVFYVISNARELSLLSSWWSLFFLCWEGIFFSLRISHQVGMVP